MYEKNLTIREKQQLAQKMRHSSQMAMTVYHKIDKANDDASSPEGRNKENIVNNFLNELKPTPEQTIELKKCIEKHTGKGFDVKEWSRNYREQNKDEIENKRKKYYDENKIDVLRKKILYNVNKNKSHPRSDTIKIYNLVFDNGVWR